MKKPAGSDAKGGRPVVREPAMRGLPNVGRMRDWILGALLLVGLVLVVHHFVGWQSLLAPWQDISTGLLITVIGLAAASYLLRAARVYDYCRPRLVGRFVPLVRLTILHNTANNLMPMRTGELVFPWLMYRYFGHPWLGSTAMLLWIRLLDLHLFGLMALVVLYLREPAWWWPVSGLLWLGALALFVVVGQAAATARQGTEEGRRWRRLVLAVVAAAPADHALIARLYVWTVLIWLLKFAAFATLLGYFVPADFWRLLVGVMGAELSSVLPFHGVAGAGSYELATVAALIPLGVDPAVALAGAVNLHLFLLGVTLLLFALAPLLPRPPATSGDRSDD
ncbi:lysylphosphatidylglycerol synthase transmembrane domain-containing protein [Thioalkalicoccus limnaeus]|uniref:Lysylphosphatidylglycerol synthase transmembrane domain-containing protein n=1 Tax=Thioalkalicoccus limnaeus TaxID=120681 RepID=A0ABV4BAF6_9GAMM